MIDLWTDLRRATRALVARPAFTVVSFLTLTIGIGSTTAVFTLVNAILLRPLPYRDPGRLVAIADVSHGETSGVGMSNYRDWRRDNTVFGEMALTQFSAGIVGRTAPGEPERVEGAEVSGSFFRLLGIEPMLGRVFGEEEERRDGEVHVLVIGHAFWQRQFGGDPAVVGRTVTFDGKPCTVIGVMPPAFWHVEGGPSDFWLPLRHWGVGRRQHQYGALARLKEGVTIEAAQAQMSSIARRIELEYPEAKGWGVRLTPLQEDLTAHARQPLAILSAAVALVLLVACANLASLLLVRTTSRAREIAVRVALGAGRARVLRDGLVESLLLALAGGGAGLALGAALTRVVSTSASARLGLPMALTIDGRVLAWALFAALTSTLAASLGPAVRASRVDLAVALKGAGPQTGVGRGQSRLLRAAVAGEIALAAVLLVAGTLLVLSLLAMLRADLGFNPDGVLTMQVRHLGTPVPRAASVEFYEELIEKVQGLPGVESAAATLALPLSNQYSGGGFAIEGRPAPEEWRKMSAQQCVVTPGYFKVMGVRLIRGRAFDARDRGTPPVVIVNRALAARHWKDDDPVGARIRVGDALLTIIGVVSDVRYNGAAAEAPPAIYYPHAQAPGSGLFLAVRVDQRRGKSTRAASAANAEVVAGIRRELRKTDAGAALVRVRPMAELVADRSGRARSVAALMTGFAGMALVLAAIGLYGTMSQWVGQRRQELGVRLSLGASPGRVLRLVLRQGLWLSAVGALAGLAAAAALTQAMSALLYGVSPRSPVAFALVPLLVGAASVAACWPPARRAARVDPVETLRAE